MSAPERIWIIDDGVASWWVRYKPKVEPMFGCAWVPEPVHAAVIAERDALKVRVDALYAELTRVKGGKSPLGQFRDLSQHRMLSGTIPPQSMRDYPEVTDEGCERMREHVRPGMEAEEWDDVPVPDTSRLREFIAKHPPQRDSYREIDPVDDASALRAHGDDPGDA